MKYYESVAIANTSSSSWKCKYKRCNVPNYWEEKLTELNLWALLHFEFIQYGGEYSCIDVSQMSSVIPARKDWWMWFFKSMLERLISYKNTTYSFSKFSSFRQALSNTLISYFRDWAVHLYRVQHSVCCRKLWWSRSTCKVWMLNKIDCEVRLGGM